MAVGGQLLRQYLGLVNNTIASQNGQQLAALLPIEPPFGADYDNLLREIFSTYSDAAALKDALRAGITVVARDDKDAWAALPEFLQTYFHFIHAVNPADLLATYEKLSSLLLKCAGALKNDPHGILILPTVLEYAKVLARLAIGLDKQPHLIAHLQVADEEQSASLPELAAMNLRPIIGTCARDSRPNGKGSAVYKLANLCMKILFQCNKAEGVPNFYNAVVMHNRPLSSYPRAERVTYLYYLGRYFFVSSQFYYALAALEAAYAECHRQATRQRRLILVYLVSASIIMGRFPSAQLYARPEAAGFQQRFQPLTDAIRAGNLAAFTQLTSLDAPHANWFLYFGILYQLRLRCEPLVWRSLARRVFAIRNPLSGTEEPNTTATTTTSQGRQKAFTLDLVDLQAVAQAQLLPLSTSCGNSTSSTTYTDPDFAGLLPAITSSTATSTAAAAAAAAPSLASVECTLASLAAQGLLSGYLSHKQRKFAVRGARNGKTPLVAGWPGAWSVLGARFAGVEVPGWRREGGSAAAGAGRGGGMVISLSGAAPAGS